MGWLGPLLGIIALYLFYIKENIFLLIVAIIVTIICFWSWGIMHNYAVKEATRRRNYSGKFYDIEEDDLYIVPDWLTFINMISTIGNLALLIVSLFM